MAWHGVKQPKMTWAETLEDFQRMRESVRARTIGWATWDRIERLLKKKAKEEKHG